MGIYINGIGMPKSYKDIRIYADGRVVSRSLHMYGEKIAIATPAADVRPVVKAHWIDIWSKLDPDTSFEVQCSKCRIISDRPAGNFCKWCGADMREES